MEQTKAEWGGRLIRSQPACVRLQPCQIGFCSMCLTIRSSFRPPRRSRFLLNDAELNVELLHMTDHSTFDLFAQGIPEERVLRSSVSRLVVDVERFENDALDSVGLTRNGCRLPAHF